MSVGAQYLSDLHVYGVFGAHTYVYVLTYKNSRRMGLCVLNYVYICVSVFTYVRMCVGVSVCVYLRIPLPCTCTILRMA